jgi:hypothetical protein
MSSINTSRVVAAGLLAGLVMNVIDFTVNVPLLGEYWDAQTRALGIPVDDMSGASALGWITSDFLRGVLLVWIYAGIRPRFGPGPRTAATAAIVLWAVTAIAYSAFFFVGLYGLKLVGASQLGGLVASLVGGQVGCRFYKEEGTVAAARV